MAQAKEITTEKRDYRVKTKLGVHKYTDIISVTYLKDAGAVILEDEKGIQGIVAMHALDTIHAEEDK